LGGCGDLIARAEDGGEGDGWVGGGGWTAGISATGDEVELRGRAGAGIGRRDGEGAGGVGCKRRCEKRCGCGAVACGACSVDLDYCALQWSCAYEDFAAKGGS